MKKFTIESWWGAIGAFVVLQCYGLLLLYLFSDALMEWKHVSGAHAFIWFNELLCFVLAFLVFSYMQGCFLERVSAYLKEPATKTLWRDEFKNPHGPVKLVILPVWLALYAVMFFRPGWLNLEPVNIVVLIIFQLVHPYASSLAVRFDLVSEIQTSRQFVSLKDALGMIFVCLIGGALLAGSFTLGLPLWLAEVLGFGLMTFGIMVFQLWNMTDGEREMPVKDPQPGERKT